MVTTAAAGFPWESSRQTIDGLRVYRRPAGVSLRCGSRRSPSRHPQSCRRAPKRCVVLWKMTHCEECGASGRLGSCSQLFHALLALDFQRLQSQGRFHGLSVACFLLQDPSHPLAATTVISGGQWQHVTTFLTAGLDAVHELEAQRVRSNRLRQRPWLALAPPPPQLHHPSTTIKDVSVDGTFPAKNYEPRMHLWAASTRAERS